MNSVGACGSDWNAMTPVPWNNSSSEALQCNKIEDFPDLPMNQLSSIKIECVENPVFWTEIEIVWGKHTVKVKQKSFFQVFQTTKLNSSALRWWKIFVILSSGRTARQHTVFYAGGDASRQILTNHVCAFFCLSSLDNYSFGGHSLIFAGLCGFDRQLFLFPCFAWHALLSMKGFGWWRDYLSMFSTLKRQLKSNNLNLNTKGPNGGGFFSNNSHWFV